MRAKEEMKLWTVLLLTMVPALPFLLLMGHAEQKLMSVLPSLCLSFPTCKKEMTGQTLTP